MELHEREFLILTEKAELYRKGELARLDAPGLVRDAFRRGFGVDTPGTPTETP